MYVGKKNAMPRMNSFIVYITAQKQVFANFKQFTNEGLQTPQKKDIWWTDAGRKQIQTRLEKVVRRELACTVKWLFIELKSLPMWWTDARSKLKYTRRERSYKVRWNAQ